MPKPDYESTRFHDLEEPPFTFVTPRPSQPVERGTPWIRMVLAVIVGCVLGAFVLINYNTLVALFH